jgi:cell division protein FtsQ
MSAALRAVMGIAALAAFTAAAWFGYRAVTSQPIRQVWFVGDIQRLARADLESLAEGLRGQPVEGASLLAVREAARRIPWVREATVRRRFPDGVEIAIESHDVLARWGEVALVNAMGEVFAAPYDGKLPRFSGPEGSSHEMTRDYPAFARALAPLGSLLAELKLSPRGAWQLVLESGLVLELGRIDTLARLERFAAAWPRLAPMNPPPQYADLRYPNGFAVRRPELPESDSPTKKKKS